MTKADVRKKIIDACISQIDTSYCAPGWFTVIVDDFDENDDVSTLVEIEGQFFEECGEVSFYDVRVDSVDAHGNEVITEAAKLASETDFYDEIERKVNQYICPEVFRAYDLEEQYC